MPVAEFPETNVPAGRRPSLHSIGLASLRDFLRTWPQLFLTDLLARSLTFVILAPLIGLLLELFLLRSPTGVLTDEEILRFLLHPLGTASLVIVGSIWLGILFAEQGVLMVISFGEVEGHRLTYLDALRYVSRMVPRLVNLAGHIILRLSFLSLPFLAGLGGAYLLLLGRHDINYYLDRQPTEFWLTAVLAGLLLPVMAILLTRKIVCWILVLPLALFQGMGGRRALQASEAGTAGNRFWIVLLFAGWMFTAFLVSILLAMVFGIARWALVPRTTGKFEFFLAGLVALFLLTVLVSFAVSFLARALPPLLIVRLYRRMAGPGRLDPRFIPSHPSDGGTVLPLSGKLLLAAAAGSLMFTAVTGYAALRSISAEDHVEILAHRGASVAAPENTMAAFERAIADGADWIELDVQENADGDVVVVHDRDFMRVAGVPLRVRDATREDLLDLDVGSRYGPEFTGQRVPTLRQVLERARGEIGVVIELKYCGYDRDLEAKVVEIVEATRMELDVAVMSLKQECIRKIAEMRPEWNYGLVNTIRLGKLKKLQVDFLALNASSATRHLIHRAHRRGMKVYVWTINDPIQMSVMMSRGVDGIITDDPALTQKVMELREEISPAGRLLLWIAGEAGL